MERDMETSRSVAELAKFYTYLADKGLMNERTAYARSQAAQQVLSVLEPEEKENLEDLDRETVFRRFVNKNGQRFTPGSLQTYKQRFNSAVDEFLSYARDPASYKPSGAGTRDRARTVSTDSRPAEPSPRTARRSPLDSGARLPSDLLAYPLPLASGSVAQLLVPPVITETDADRITSLVSAMVKALARREDST